MLWTTVTTTVCISAREKGKDGPQTAGWYFRLDGRVDDADAITQAIARAENKFGATHDNFRFAKRDDNVQWAPAGTRFPDGCTYRYLFQWEPGD